jgi:hypothetical protein
VARTTFAFGRVLPSLLEEMIPRIFPPDCAIADGVRRIQKKKAPRKSSGLLQTVRQDAGRIAKGARSDIRRSIRTDAQTDNRKVLLQSSGSSHTEPSTPEDSER